MVWPTLGSRTAKEQEQELRPTLLIIYVISEENKLYNYTATEVAYSE